MKCCSFDSSADRFVVVVPTEEELKKFGYNKASLNHVLNGVSRLIIFMQ